MDKNKAKEIADGYEFSKILSDIRYAADHGKYERVVRLTPKEKEKLELMGYTLTESSQVPCGYYAKNNSTAYLVSWK